MQERTELLRDLKSGARMIEIPQQEEANAGGAGATPSSAPPSSHEGDEEIPF
jgi:hypothetical protein